MDNRGGGSGRRDPWQYMFAKASRMRPPNRQPLTSDGPFGRHRQEPEVIEHMLDDLEMRMRNYFLLYNRERDMRKRAEENNYRLEQELAEERKKLGQAQINIEQLHSKIRSLVGQPIKIKETIDKIEFLHHQMDTLIQAFIGIGSFATLQGQNPTSFLRIFLEYLHPCRDLDVRLNTLYTAMYSSLSFSGSDPSPKQLPTPMEPRMPDPPSQSRRLSGIAIVVHQLLLKTTVTNSDSEVYVCTFRYDHESAEELENNTSRRISANVKPLDNASGIIGFNGCIRVEQLPPRIPNVIPKLILTIMADSVTIGTANMSIVDEKTLREREPWTILDDKGNHCGDVIVTIRPIPDDAKLPAMGFARRYDEVMISAPKPEPTDNISQFVPTVPDKPSQPKDAKAAGTVTAKPQSFASPAAGTSEASKSVPSKAFVPKQKATFRRPLILKGKSPVKAASASVNKTDDNKKNEQSQEKTGDAESASAAPQGSVEPPQMEKPKTTVPQPTTKAAVSPPPKMVPKAKKETPPLKSVAPKLVPKLPVKAKEVPSTSDATSAATDPSPQPPVDEDKPAQETMPKAQIAPKVAPPVAKKSLSPPEAKAPLITPKVVTPPKSVPLTPKANLPSVPPPETTEKPTGGTPLVPIIVKPKFILKKPVTPKKA